MQGKSTQFFENMMSSDKGVREGAEKEFEKLKTMPLKETINLFSECLETDNETLFQFCTIMLKKAYCEPEQIKNLSDEDKQLLLTLIKSKIDLSGKKTWKSLQRIGDVLGILYKNTNLINGVNEIVNLFNDQNNALSRKFAIYIIEILCEIGAITEKVLDENSVQNFKQIFMKGLNDSNIEVQVSSLLTTNQFLNNIVNEKILLLFSELSDSILKTVVTTLKYEKESNKMEIPEETQGKIALESLNEIIDNHPKFWKGRTEDIINIVNQISKGNLFPNLIRELALELVFSLTKNNQSIIKKSPNFKNLFIPLLFELMLEIDNVNNIEQWEKQKEDEEKSKEEMYYAVEESFDRLSADLGGVFMMNIISDLLKKYLGSNNWIEVHAAFGILANLSEGCKDIFKKNLKEILEYISHGLTHQHCRVRYNALTAFGLILKVTAPKPQVEYTNNILPALVQLMSDKETSIRVKTQSCCALVEYLRGLLNDELSSEESQEIIKNYTNDLVTIISRLFEYSLTISNPCLQENTLSAISLLSNLLEANFAPYYNQLMPGLKKLFYNLDAKTEDQKTLKSNTIETMSFLLSSIKDEKEKYINDLKELSQAFLNYMDKLQEEDPQYPTIMNSFTHISSSMREDFLPVFDILLPKLLKNMDKEIQLKVEDAALDEYVKKDNKEKGVGSVLFNIGSQTAKFSLHTFDLQNKILSFNVFTEIAKNLEKNFNKYLKLLLEKIIKLISFPYSKAIRKQSYKAIGYAFNVCNNNEEKKLTMDNLSDVIIKIYKDNLNKPNMKEIKAMLKELIEAFNLIEDKNCFNEKFIKEFYECLSETCKQIDNLKNMLIERVMKSDLDEDELNEEYDIFDRYNEIERRVMETNGIIFKIFGNSLTALVSKSLFDSFLNNWNNDLNRKKCKSDQEILSSICFFADYIEFSDLSVLEMIVPVFIENCLKYKTENEDILQSIVYGFGVISKVYKKDLFVKYKQNIATFIGNLMQREVNEDNGKTYDNAVSAMGKFLIYQCENDQNTQNMVKQFIKLLPFKYDLDECKTICEIFFNCILTNNPIIMNPSNENEIKISIQNIKKANNEKHFLDNLEPILNDICQKLGL